MLLKYFLLLLASLGAGYATYGSGAFHGGMCLIGG